MWYRHTPREDPSPQYFDSALDRNPFFTCVKFFDRDVMEYYVVLRAQRNSDDKGL